MKIPTIKTSRLILRAFTKEDFIPFHHILNEREVLRYFPSSSPPSLERVENMVAEQLKHWAKYGYGWWAVEEQRENKFIGWCGLQYLPETKEVEIAYLLSQSNWGKGLATEGARASLKYGFEELGLKNIVGIVHPKNGASQRVLEKLGMEFTSETQYFGMDCYHYLIKHSGYEQLLNSVLHDSSKIRPERSL